MKKIILDVDTGIDDAIAIMLSLASDNIELLGITTLGGNINLDQVLINTKKLLKYLGREDIKVYKGSKTPLKRALVDASHIHGKDGLAGQLKDIKVDDSHSGSALEFLEESINKYGEELTIIMTGPETNLAKLLIDKPHLSKKVKNVIAMGGAIDVIGNATPVSEFNIVTDPEAAFKCFQSKIENFSLVSLDVTMDALITKNDLSKIKDENIRNLVLGLTNDYMVRYNKKHNIYGCPMHDPLTILYLLNPSLMKTERRHVTVEKCGEFTTGMTVCDYNNQICNQSNLIICKDLNVEVFKRDFFNLINKLELK